MKRSTAARCPMCGRRQVREATTPGDHPAKVYVCRPPLGCGHSWTEVPRPDLDLARRLFGRKPGGGGSGGTS